MELFDPFSPKAKSHKAKVRDNPPTCAACNDYGYVRREIGGGIGWEIQACSRCNHPFDNRGTNKAWWAAKKAKDEHSS